MSVVTAEDRSLSIRLDQVVKSAWVDIDLVRKGNNAPISMAAVEKAHHRIINMGDCEAWPPAIGHWEGEVGESTFFVMDGRHHYIASLIANRDKMYVAWLEDKEAEPQTVCNNRVPGRVANPPTMGKFVSNIPMYENGEIHFKLGEYGVPVPHIGSYTDEGGIVHDIYGNYGSIETIPGIKAAPDYKEPEDVRTYGVCVLVLTKDRKILLSRRKDPTKPYYGFWGPPAGMIEDSDEGPRQAAARELKEETGLIVDPFKLWYIDQCWKGSFHLHTYAYLKTDDAFAECKEPHKHGAWIFMGESSFENMDMIEPDAANATKAMDILLGEKKDG